MLRWSGFSGFGCNERELIGDGHGIERAEPLTRAKPRARDELRG